MNKNALDERLKSLAVNIDEYIADRSKQEKTIKLYLAKIAALRQTGEQDMREIRRLKAETRKTLRRLKAA